MAEENKRIARGKILVVEDERFYQELCREVLEEEGYEVESTFTGEEAIAKIRDKAYHIVILDQVLPGIDGMEVLGRVRQLRPNMDVIMMTGFASVENAVKALKSGASDYLTKPVNPEELKLAVKRCIEFRGLFEENTELKGLLKLYHNVQLVSNTIELDKLYELSLDAILQGVNAETGVGVFPETTSGETSLRSFRGMDGDSARRIAHEITEKLRAPHAEQIAIDLDFKAPDGVNERLPSSAIYIPLSPHGSNISECQGMVAAYRDGGFGESEIANAKFIAEQVAMSLENALNYSGAQKMVFVDDLTGLYNMRHLDVALSNEIKRAKRYKSNVSLLFMDLDYFKEINDTYGHLVGSNMLRETAQIIRKCIREIDVGIRYGGDEFIVILVETGHEGAMRVAERMRKRIEEHRFLAREGVDVHMTCCVGVASYPQDAQTKIDLIHLADKAMYRGKETTRNVIYSAASL